MLNFVLSSVDSTMYHCIRLLNAIMQNAETPSQIVRTLIDVQKYRIYHSFTRQRHCTE